MLTDTDVTGGDSGNRKASVDFAAEGITATGRTVVACGAGRAADLPGAMADALAETQAVARRVAALGDR